MGTLAIAGSITGSVSGSGSVSYDIQDQFSNNGGSYPELHGRTPDTFNAPSNTWAVALGTSDKYECVSSPSDHLRNETAADGWGAGIDCGQENKRVECNVEIATSVSGTTSIKICAREGGGSSYALAMITRTSATTAVLKCRKNASGLVDSNTIALDGTQDSWEIVVEDVSDGLIAWDAANSGLKTNSLDISTVASGTQSAGVRRDASDLVAVTDCKYRNFRVTLL